MQINSFTLFALVKTAHVVAVMLFLGGTLLSCMVGRVVCQHPHLNNPQNRALLVGVHRWDRTVTSPALLFVWVLGVLLAVWSGAFPSAWLSVKVAIAIALSMLHGLQSASVRRLIGGQQVAAWSLGLAPAMTVAGLASLAVALVVVKPLA